MMKMQRMIELNIPQKSMTWHMLRNGCVTGTTLRRAVGRSTTQSKFTNEIIARRLNQPDPLEFHTLAMERGNNLEGEALLIAGHDLCVDFEPLGMMVSTDIPNFIISPDGVVRGPERQIIGGGEVKCPNSDTHIKYKVDNKLPNEYRHQVYAPFLMSKLIKFWWFISYDPRVKDSPTFYYYVMRKDIQKELDVIEEKLGAFIAHTNKKHCEMITGFTGEIE